MKQMRSHPASRWLARLLAFLTVVPYLSIGVGVQKAEAQRQPVLVYVLDFNNRSDIGGPLLGRQAAAQLAVELNESGNWSVIPDRTVQGQVQALGLRPPFDKVDRQRIGLGIDADAVIYGSVISASVDDDEPMQARVRLQIVAEDVRTGTLFNGTVVDGVSVPRMGYAGDADILLEEALAKAAFKARQTMDRFRAPEGTVLTTSVIDEGSKMRALINIGARQGVKRDQEFVVTRRGDLVGFVKVMSVNPNDAMADIISNVQGVRPEDRVRGLFKFEELKTPEKMDRLRERNRADSGGATQVAVKPEPSKQGKAAKAKQARLARRAGALSLAKDKGGSFEPMVAAGPEPGETLLAQNGKGADDSNMVVIDEPRSVRRRRKRSWLTAPTALILAGGAILAGVLLIGGRKNETRPFAVNAVLVQPDGVGTSTTGIRVLWDKPRGVPGAQGGEKPFGGILGYIVWRTDQMGTGSPEVVGGTLGDVRVFLDNLTVTHDVPNVISGTPTRAPGSGAGAPATVVGVAGLVPGHVYQYQIMTAYETVTDLDGDGLPETTPVPLLSPLSPYSNRVTYIQPGTIVSPTQNQFVDLTNLSVIFNTTAGADTYQLVVSRDLTLAPDRTFRGQIITVVPPDRGGPPQAAILAQNITAASNAIGAGGITFVTILAWSSGDPIRPEPFGGVTYPPIQVRQAPIGP